MFHKSKIGEHAEKFPSDKDGHVPDEGDTWRDMNFEHGSNDPDEEGISDEERARRVAHLDQQWWPQVLAQVAQERAKIEVTPHDTPLRHWTDNVRMDEKPYKGTDIETQ